jgi:hypothetical protein
MASNIGEWLLKSIIARDSDYNELKDLREWKRINSCTTCEKNDSTLCNMLCNMCDAYMCTVCVNMNIPSSHYSTYCGICGFDICNVCINRKGVEVAHKQFAIDNGIVPIDRKQCHLEMNLKKVNSSIP